MLLCTTSLPFPLHTGSRRYPSSMMSPRLRSPSPTMGSFSFNNDMTSPMSASSESSGVGSRKSSSDFLHLDGARERFYLYILNFNHPWKTVDFIYFD